MLELHITRCLRGGARLVVVVLTQKVERARTNIADAFIPPRIDDSRADEKRHAAVVEFPVGEVGPAVANRAVAAPDEQAQAALCSLRIARLRGPITARERVAEFVERRAPGRQRLLERRQ